VISLETHTSQSYANSRAGDRAGFFVVQARGVSAETKVCNFKRVKGTAGGGSRVVQPRIFCFSLFGSVIFGRVASFTGLFCTFSNSPDPLTGIYRRVGVDCAQQLADEVSQRVTPAAILAARIRKPARRRFC
jgi:hypothetical protein